MELLVRPALLSLNDPLLEIDALLSGSSLSFALFLSRDHMILANNAFIKRWGLERASFPRFSLSDFANRNAVDLTGETKGRFWTWFSTSSPGPSMIVLPGETGGERLLLRVPTEKTSGDDPFFLELLTEKASEGEKEGMLLLANRIKTQARAIIRNIQDEILIDQFFRSEIAQDSHASKAEIILTKTPSWGPEARFWRIHRSPQTPSRLTASILPAEETQTLFPFRRIQFARNSTQGGYWADFPILANRSFFGKIRLFRPEALKRELPGLSKFQTKAQELSQGLFQIRINLGDLDPVAREPESGFLDRREALLLLESLIEEYRSSGMGFGLIGIKIDLANHQLLMMKIRKILRYYDEIAHITPREYLLILPGMKAASVQGLVERVEDMLLGGDRDFAHLVTMGTLSFPEAEKGPMNLMRSVFLRKESQPLQPSEDKP
ncbi:MAG: hypothetical protein ACP5OP_08995 [Leptospirillia bacterium]